MTNTPAEKRCASIGVCASESGDDLEAESRKNEQVFRPGPGRKRPANAHGKSSRPREGGPRKARRKNGHGDEGVAEDAGSQGLADGYGRGAGDRADGRAG